MENCIYPSRFFSPKVLHSIKLPFIRDNFTLGFLKT